MSIAAAIESDHGEIYAVVGSGNLGVAFGGGCCGENCRSGGKLAAKFASRDHIISLKFSVSVGAGETSAAG